MPPNELENLKYLGLDHFHPSFVRPEVSPSGGPGPGPVLVPWTAPVLGHLIWSGGEEWQGLKTGHP